MMVVRLFSSGVDGSNLSSHSSHNLLLTTTPPSPSKHNDRLLLDMTMMTYQQVKKLRSRVHKSRAHTNVQQRSTPAVDLLDAVTPPETTDDEGDETTTAEDSYYQSDEETQIAQAMARAVFTNSTPMLNLLLKAAFQEEQEERNQQKKMINKNLNDTAVNSSSSKRSRDHDAIASSTTMSTTQRQPLTSSSTRSSKKARRTSPVRLSASAPSLKCLANEDQQPTKSTCSVKPSEKLQSLLAEAGYAYKTYDYTSLTTMGFFIKLTSAQINLYDTDLVRTVRDQDLSALQERRANVPSLHAGNKFGETILHASCRRAAFPIVQYLLSEGGHPVRVCCDYGRTVLHDAAWTCTPNLAVIDLLLNVCPDLLYVCDRRGYTALDYIPKDQYAVWCDYLTTRTAERLRPVVLQS
jgi:Ankyrin repeats (3 copies)